VLTPSTLPALQAAIADAGVDGWLLFDFQGCNPIAGGLLGLEGMVTRRIFVWVPREGAPSALGHAIELDAGEKGPVRPVADAEGDEGVGVRVRDVIEPARRQHRERHVRVHLLELADMGAQEHGGEAWRAGNGERAADAGAVRLRSRVAEHGQRLPDIGGVALAARRQRHPLADALQQIEAEIALQQPQLVAHRAAGEVQFVGGTPDAAMPGETVEGAQRLRGWNSQEVNRICMNRENISLFGEPLHCFL